jgi:hypothetical protein
MITSNPPTCSVSTKNRTSLSPRPSRSNPVAGDVVASHYIGFDPASALGQVGYIDFDADIYGVATHRTKLNDSDFLANTGVTYLSDSLRGLESGDSVMIDPTNSKRLLVNWFANSPGDYVRVFTQFSAAAVPAPPVAGFLLLGVGFLAARRRVRRRAR